MKKLQAETLRDDPRIAEAKRLIAEAMGECSKKITGVKGANAERKGEFEQIVKSFGEVRAGDLYYPYLGSGAGNGALVELADGSVKFDMISGIGVHHWGHGNPMIAMAAVDAAIGDTIMQGNLQANADSAELAKTLAGMSAAGSGGNVRHCFLSSSGAIANENAMKVVFHKKPGADRLLAFEHGFAGRTMTLAQVTDKAAYRVGLPTVLAVDFVPFFDAKNPESVARSLGILREHLKRHPGKHAAMWFELIQGEGGYYPGTREFFRALMEELRAAKIAVVADEIQTFGRTTRAFAFEHFELGDLIDVVTVGKMLQICATLFSDAYKPGPGLLSQTFTASTSAIHAAQVMLNDLNSGKYFGADGRNMQVHRRFVERFEKIAAKIPGAIRGPFGLGGMVAFQIFGGVEKETKAFLRQLFDAGVIAFYCGDSPTRVRFLPPIGAVTDEQIDAVCEILETALAKGGADGGHSARAGGGS